MNHEHKLCPHPFLLSLNAAQILFITPYEFSKVHAMCNSFKSPFMDRYWTAVPNMYYFIDESQGFNHGETPLSSQHTTTNGF